MLKTNTLNTSNKDCLSVLCWNCEKNSTKRCSWCKCATYCSLECLKEDWQHGGHDLFCHVLSCESENKNNDNIQMNIYKFYKNDFIKDTFSPSKAVEDFFSKVGSLTHNQSVDFSYLTEIKSQTPEALLLSENTIALAQIEKDYGCDQQTTTLVVNPLVGKNYKTNGESVKKFKKEKRSSRRTSRNVSISPSKARKILRDGSIRGKPLTERQRRFFGEIASRSRRRNRR